MIKPYNTPAEVDAEEGEVIVEGPGGHMYSLTPDAAAETSDRLLFGAAKAVGQQVQAKERATRSPS